MALSSGVLPRRVAISACALMSAFSIATVPACERTRSGILVRIETDLSIGSMGEVKGVRLRVASGSGAIGGWRLDNAYPMHLRALDPATFQFRALVLPLQDDATRVVTVEAWLCDTPTCPVEAPPLVLQRAIFSFVQGEQRELVMFMSDVCRGMRCVRPTDTCRGRVPGCRSAVYDASLLPGIGETPADDGGVGDSSRIDGGTGPAVDGGSDDRPGGAGDGAPTDGADGGPDASDAELCGGRVCADGERCCHGGCVDVQANRLQCGACDAPCGTLQYCEAGRCLCPSGQTVCRGDCINTLTDRFNCGGCGNECRGVLSCADSRCQCIDQGNMEQMCGGVCLALADNTDHCGRCDVACPFSTRCVRGVCECSSTEIRCGAACVDRMNDAAHCNLCDTDCGADRQCTAGACAARVVPAAPTSCSAGAATCVLRTIPSATVALGADGVTGAAPPRTGVSVDTFRLDANEVTVERFRAFWNAGHSGIGGHVVSYPGGVMLRVAAEVRPPVETIRNSRCTWSPFPSGREDQPINCVDWATAQAFCVWDGGRLPTEAEWEVAARGARGRVYPWGDIAMVGGACVTDGSAARSTTCAVGDSTCEVDVTPERVSHLLGDVAEYTADVYEPFTDARCWGAGPRANPLCQPAAASDTPPRTIRGASWDSRGPFHLAARAAAPADGSPSIGFRCARTGSGM